MAHASVAVSSTAAHSDLESLGVELNGKIFMNVPGYHTKYFPETTKTSTRLSSSPVEFCSDMFNLLMKVSSSSKGSFSNRSFNLQNANEIVLTLNSPTPLVDPIPDTAILVFGLCQRDPSASSDENILAFCSRAIAVFAARPHRTFLHAFRIYGSSIETWTFDRAGAYSGRAVDVRNEPELFRQIVAGYLSMNNDHLGLNPVVDIASQHISIKLEGTNQIERFAIDAQALVEQEDFIGPGTSCFKTLSANSLEGQFIVKFAWTPDEIPGERRFLQVVRDKNIWGVVRLEGYQYLCTIEGIRRGLRFDLQYIFSTSRNDQNNAAKYRNPAEMGPANCNVTTRFQNLKFECIVTSPLGRPLDTFSTPSELFKILRDIVKALRSLYLEVNIIHRDISTQNIVIALKDGQDLSGPTGILIDLNLALDLSHPPEKENLVGSEGFMAIGILGGDNVTYRHDLESVFYVFLWMAICHDGTTSKHIPDKSRLHAWCGTDWLASFNSKRKDMQPENFAGWIEDEFSARFRPHLPLAVRLHELLFPVENDSIFIGTNFDRDATTQLYEDFITAFLEAATS